MLSHIRAVLLELVCGLTLVELLTLMELFLQPREVTDEHGAVANVRLPEAYGKRPSTEGSNI